jgi:hypothetical protein
LLEQFFNASVDMVIRAEQIAVFERKAQTDFVTSLRDYLCRSHGTVRVRLPIGVYRLQDIPGHVLTELVQRSIEKGRLYSLAWQSSLAAFVTLMFVAAPNFDADPFIHRTLTDPAIPANDRIDRVCRWATTPYWEKVRKAYDPAAWAASLPTGPAA